ncbi:hypothetical protein B7494_g8544 [Chlorociboria aeruginascens]|nr:hypothetical protein B7494_g8544 [Chlorociboria aeruginascens]
MSTTNGPTNPSKAKARTVTWQEASEWQLDNKYILRGYRPEKADYLEIFTSLTFLHNETCNVYTHLVGALLLPLVAPLFLRYLAESQFLHVSSMDYAMFGIYFWCAEICLVLSTLYHLMLPHSHLAELFWHGMDLLGIVIVTMATFSSGIYYIFFCEASLQKVHWAIILTTGTATGVLISNPSLRNPRWRKVKVGVFVVFGASSFVPLLHGVQRYGLEYMLHYSGMKWYLLELTLYGIAVSLYAFRIPERLAPGKFDIWGSSHQIFHVAILCAMYTHVTALLQGFTTCHTLDTDDDTAALDALEAEAKEFSKDAEIDRILKAFRLDAYAVLDLQPGVPESDIKKCYRIKSLLIHPDKTSNPSAPDAFDRLKKAQTELMDEKHRMRLDESIADARMLLMREKKWDQDNEGLKSAEFAKEWREKTKMVLVDVEQRRRRQLRAEMQEQGREQRKEEEEIEKRKRKREFENEWESQREERIGSWRDFQKGGDAKKKKKKMKPIGYLKQFSSRILLGISNYAYGGGYTTTTYGAQGGAEGGGFVAGGYGGGSQGGSQDSPGGSKTYGKETLRPVTIKQLIDATQPHPEADFKIDGADITQTSFIGQIHTISPQATNTTYKLDDGTGLIEVKQWIDGDADPANAKPLPTEGQYLRVWGRLKSFNNKRHVGAHVIRPISDFNEISMHLLEATAVHLYFTRGPPGGANGVKTENGGGGMFVDGYNGVDNTNAGAGKQLSAKITPNGRKVFALIQSAPQNNEGLHVQNIATQLGIPANDVFKAGDELLAEGLIYTTIDDETWAVLEY